MYLAGNQFSRFHKKRQTLVCVAPIALKTWRKFLQTSAFDYNGISNGNNTADRHFSCELHASQIQVDAAYVCLCLLIKYLCSPLIKRRLNLTKQKIAEHRRTHQFAYHLLMN